MRDLNSSTSGSPPITESFAVASAPAAFRVRVWHLMSRGQGPAAQRSPLEGARVGYPLLALESCRVRVRQDAARMEFVMMMEGCGVGMMVMMWVAGLLIARPGSPLPCPRARRRLRP